MLSYGNDVRHTSLRRSAKGTGRMLVLRNGNMGSLVVNTDPNLVKRTTIRLQLFNVMGHGGLDVAELSYMIVFLWSSTSPRPKQLTTSSVPLRYGHRYPEYWLSRQDLPF